MIEMKTPEQTGNRIVLFSIDGREYDIPAKPRANIALKYLWEVKQRGQEVAAATLLEELIGAEGFQALMEYDDLTQDQLKTVMEAAQKVVLGNAEAPKGR